MIHSLRVACAVEHRQELTLAQRMGLVQRPPTPLTGEIFVDAYLDA
jgi:hypothetical protein